MFWCVGKCRGRAESLDGAFGAGYRPEGVLYSGAINRKAIAAQFGNKDNGGLRPPHSCEGRTGFVVNGNILGRERGLMVAAELIPNFVLDTGQKKKWYNMGCFFF